MFWAVAFGLSFVYKAMLCDKVTQNSMEQRVGLGGEVTLLCTYDMGVSNPDLYWYRVRPDHSFQFVLYRDNTQSKDADFTQGRFSVKHSQTQKTFHLVISSVKIQDAAMYYCAVPHFGISLDKLIFGKGTRVTVEPKKQTPVKPSVFVMRNGTTVACLVKDFYPKNVTISLNSSKKVTEFKPAIAVAPSGKYSAVKLGKYEDSQSVTCSVQHNNVTVNSTDLQPEENNSERTEPEKKEQTSASCLEPKAVGHIWKVNMTSLTLLGLRLVLVKSVAINFLLTAKLIFF